MASGPASGLTLLAGHYRAEVHGRRPGRRATRRCRCSAGSIGYMGRSRASTTYSCSSVRRANIRAGATTAVHTRPIASGACR
jgi:hypothetical protein